MKIKNLLQLRHRVSLSLFRALLASGAILSCVGCQTLKLPAVTADIFDYKRSDTWGGTVIHAEAVKSDGATVSAAVVQWNTTYPFFNIAVSAKNFTQSSIAPSSK